MQTTKFVPRPSPPAWPVLVSNILAWVAMGPFGLLPNSFQSADKARDAAFAAYKELWAVQADRDKTTLASLAMTRVCEDAPIPYFPDGKAAVWIDGNTEAKFLAVYDIDFSEVEALGYADVSELIARLELQDEPRDAP